MQLRSVLAPGADQQLRWGRAAPNLLPYRGASGAVPAVRDDRASTIHILMSDVSRAAYVIMIAGANDISSGAIGLVYLAAILPSLCLKITAPYW